MQVLAILLWYLLIRIDSEGWQLVPTGSRPLHLIRSLCRVLGIRCPTVLVWLRLVVALLRELGNVVRCIRGIAMGSTVISRRLSIGHAVMWALRVLWLALHGWPISIRRSRMLYRARWW